MSRLRDQSLTTNEDAANGEEEEGAKDPVVQRRKRKRLNAVLDKITNHLSARNQNVIQPASADDNGNNNNSDDETAANNINPVVVNLRSEAPVERKLSNAALRRERWRENQQQLSSEEPSSKSFQRGKDVFRFDSFDRDRYLSGSSSLGGGRDDFVHLLPGAHLSSEEGPFTPGSGRSPHSSLSSPQISAESPRICFSPLRIKDSIEEEEDDNNKQNKLSVPQGCDSEAAQNGTKWLLQNKLHSLSRPNSPNLVTPPMPLHSLRHLPAYLTEIYRRKCLSDTDLNWEAKRQTKTSGKPIKADATTTSQESPLDLSVRNSIDDVVHSPAAMVAEGSIERPRGRVKSSKALRIATNMERYSLDRLEVSPLVDGSNGNSDVSASFVCPVCGQMFSLSDRLAKHMASRHKSRSTDSGTKAYMCEVCKRSFARSDMLTRHMRLHTGLKPYTCRVCGQVFSRSDHLSTHQRTHTGEKPYRCPSCPYAACRRDMITRHMRTHARYELPDSTFEDNDEYSASAEPNRPASVDSTGQGIGAEEQKQPPSPMDTGEEPRGDK